MKEINPQMIVATIVHAVIGVFMIDDPHYGGLAIVIGAIVMFNIIGILLVVMGYKVAGARIFMIASIILVPIGLIGVFGARKILDKVKKDKFYNLNE